MQRVLQIPGAQVLRRVDEPIVEKPSPDIANTQPKSIEATEADKKVIDASKLPTNWNKNQTVEANARPSSWSYHEQRFFYEYLRMIKGDQIKEDCANSIAMVMKTKNATQVRRFYDRTISHIKRHLKDRYNKDSTLENLHYAMVCYWEKIALPSFERKHQDSKISKDSIADTDKKTNATIELNGLKHIKTGTSPGQGSEQEGAITTTPTNSVTLGQQNQVSAQYGVHRSGGVMDEKAARAAAAASRSRIHPDLFSLRISAAAEVIPVLLSKGYVEAAVVTVFPSTPVFKLIHIITTQFQHALPNGLGTSVYLVPPADCNIALHGICWGGSQCSPDVTVGHILQLLPTPPADELYSLHFTWNVKDENKGAKIVGVVTTPKSNVHPAVGTNKQMDQVTNMRGGNKKPQEKEVPLSQAPRVVHEESPCLDKKRKRDETAQPVVPPSPSHPVIAALPAVGVIPASTQLPVSTQPAEKVEHDNKVAKEAEKNSLDAKRPRTESKADATARNNNGSQGGIDGSEKPAEPVTIRSLSKNPPPLKPARKPRAPRKNAKSQQQSAPAPQPVFAFGQPQMGMFGMNMAPAHMFGAMPLPAGMATYLNWQQMQQQMAYQQQMHQQMAAAPVLQTQTAGMPPQAQSPLAPLDPSQFWSAVQQQQQQEQQQPLPSAKHAPQEAQQLVEPEPLFKEGFGGSLGDSFFADVLQSALRDTDENKSKTIDGEFKKPVSRPSSARTSRPSSAAQPASTKATTVNVQPQVGGFDTPKKALEAAETVAEATAHTGGPADSILKMPRENWACLSPPANFKPTLDFDENADTRTVNTNSITCVSLLPATSLLEYMDAKPKVHGKAAVLIRNGIDALLEDFGVVVDKRTDDDMEVDDDMKGVDGPAGNHSLHSFGSMLEKDNSSWMMPFEVAQNLCGDKQDKEKSKDKPKQATTVDVEREEVSKKPVERPFAILFGN